MALVAVERFDVRPCEFLNRRQTRVNELKV